MSASTQPDFRALFAHQVSLPDDQVDLPRAALYLAGEAYPDLDAEEYLGRLDAMAGEVAELAGRAASGADLARTLNRYLFDLQGFAGNAQDYYNPENSFLNRVMDTKVGIPITLSVLYLGLSQRLGLHCYGVGMPGHFLVCIQELDLYLDPFHAGELLSAGDCRRLAQSLFGPGVDWNDGFLAPTPAKLIPARMLNNLRHIYAHDRDYRRLAATLERMLLVDESNISLYKELVSCQLKMGDQVAAIRSLETLIRRADNDRDVAAARNLLDNLLRGEGQAG